METENRDTNSHQTHKLESSRILDGSNHVSCLASRRDRCVNAAFNDLNWQKYTLHLSATLGGGTRSGRWLADQCGCDRLSRDLAIRWVLTVAPLQRLLFVCIFTQARDGAWTSESDSC